MGDVVTHHVGDVRSIARLADGTRPTAAISIEVLAEIPDVDEVFRQTRGLLAPRGRIAFCDVVSVAPGSDRLSDRVLRSGLAWTTATLYGDAWRSEDDYRRALERAGFVDVTVERIGSKTYGPTYAHAKTRLREIRERGLPRSATALAYANLGLLDMLHAAGRIEYSVFSARCPS
jgi:hypothetical protein